MTIDVDNLTIKRAHGHLVKGNFTAVELARACAERVEEYDSDVHAYLEVFDDIERQAEVADDTIKQGKASLMTGIPLGMKDNILIKGRRASAASKILKGYTATYDATVVHKLKDAGAVFLGRTNCDEFAMGSSTENSAFGVTSNPCDRSRVAGGSSGGSAAAVAYGGCLAALGSETGGSVRQPASFCGVVGLKPTYGAVSRYGLIALGSSFDQIGPLGKTVSDVEILFNAIKGKDPLDSTSLLHEPKAKSQKPKTVLGIPRHFLSEGVDVDVLEHFETSLRELKEKGYTIQDIELPRVKHSLAVYYVIMPAEASANLARYDGVKYGFHAEGGDLFGDYYKTRGHGFGAEARRRIILGTYVLSAGYYDAYYGKANAVRSLIAKDFTDAFASVDAIVTPTAPTPAFRVGEKADPLSMYLSDIFTVPANLAGIPALSVPMGTVERDGAVLPTGLQIMGPLMGEDTLFSIGKDFLGEKDDD